MWTQGVYLTLGTISLLPSLIINKFVYLFISLEKIKCRLKFVRIDGWFWLRNLFISISFEIFNLFNKLKVICICGKRQSFHQFQCAIKMSIVLDWSIFQVSFTQFFVTIYGFLMTSKIPIIDFQRSYKVPYRFLQILFSHIKLPQVIVNICNNETLFLFQKIQSSLIILFRFVKLIFLDQNSSQIIESCSQQVCCVSIFCCFNHIYCFEIITFCLDKVVQLFVCHPQSVVYF